MKRFYYALLLAVSFFIVPSVAADAPKPEPLSPALSAPVKVTMRTNGYTIGDLIETHVVFNLKKGQTFDPDSVPLKGPVNNWLDLREAKLFTSKNADDSTHVKLDFTWQIFGTVEMAQLIYIPAIALQTIPPEVGNTKPITITIPAQGFHLSPVLPQTVEDKVRRPHAPPLRFDAHTPLTIALLCLGFGLLLLGIYLWLLDKITWWPRNPGPLTKLARQMRAHKAASFSVEDLRNIHSGLARSAGQSLYPNTLANLFEKSPYLLVDKSEITQFFEASWRVFHSQNSQANDISTSATKAWIQRAAMAERLSRRHEKKFVRIIKKAHA